MPRSRSLSLLALLGAIVWSLALAPLVAAHSGVQVGEFLVEVGWRVEPAFVGQPNAVQVIVRHHDTEAPVLRGVALEVVVETAGQSTDPLELTPAFDAEERTGSLGEYGVALIPTAPGDYTFHITGTIANTAVDLDLTSGEETFDPVVGSSDAQFPVALPNLTEVATRLDRIDSRIAALQSADPGTDLTQAVEAAEAATDAAQTATAAANQAMLVGAVLGIVGIVVGAIGIALALRAGRRGTSPA